MAAVMAVVFLKASSIKLDSTVFCTVMVARAERAVRLVEVSAPAVESEPEKNRSEMGGTAKELL